jgi:DNA-nicking Smr family endonuclease
MLEDMLRLLASVFTCLWSCLRGSETAQYSKFDNDIQFQTSRQYPFESGARNDNSWRKKSDRSVKYYASGVSEGRVQFMTTELGDMQMHEINEQINGRRGDKRRLTDEDKQAIYEKARTPVNNMCKERAELRKQLKRLPQKGHNNAEFKKTQALIQDIERKLPLAEKKAADDIFNKMNAVSGMGLNKFDFHGLHVNEAKIIARDIIVPALATAKQITIITGRGVHSKDGISKLREALPKYFMHELKIRCRSFSDNDGGFIVSK